MQMQRDILEKVGISQVEIRHLEAAWDTYQTAVAQPVHQIPHIVCTGIYNAGKSTLLNALCGEEKFPTGDIPTTKEVAQAEFGGAVYIDTPGLNAMDEDDRETQAAYESADFILFVANAQNGGISSAEAKWLQRLKEQYGSLQQRLIYVLAHCSQVEPEQLPEIRKKTLNDFRKSVGLDPEWILCVDSITYQDGVTQNELLLSENSGIPQLKSCLDERVAGAEKTMREARDAELATRREDLTNRLEHCKKFCHKKTDGLEATLAQQKQDIQKGWSEFLSKLESVLSNRPSPYISRYMDHPSFRSYNEVKDTSESSVKRKAADCLHSRYNERESTLRKSVRQAKEDLAPYLRKGPGSKYWTMCSQVNQEFEAIVLKLLQT